MKHIFLPFKINIIFLCNKALYYQSRQMQFGWKQKNGRERKQEKERQQFYHLVNLITNVIYDNIFIIFLWSGNGKVFSCAFDVYVNINVCVQK